MMRRISDHTLHVLLEIVLAATALGTIAAGALVWRLHQGPIEITALVQRLQSRLLPDTVRLRVGAAALAWEGFSGTDSPLDIRWQDLVLSDPQGGDLARLPRGRVTLDLPSLVRGHLVPRLVQLDGATLTLERLPGGGTQVALGEGAPASNSALRIVQALQRRAAANDPLGVLGQLRHIGIRDATLAVRDDDRGLVWQAKIPSAVLSRAADGGLWGHAQLDMRVGSTALTVTASANLTDAGTQLVVGTTPVVPFALALSAPVFAPLAAIDAPASAALAATLGPDLDLREATVSLQAGAGRVNTGRGQAPIDSAALVAVLRGPSIDVTKLIVQFHRPVEAVAAAPVLTGHAHAALAAGVWQADFGLDIPSLSFADLPLYWPYGTGGGSRSWIVSNITSGTAHDAHVGGKLAVTLDGAVALHAIEAGLTADGLTVAWLRPIPPLQNGTARLTLEGRDALRITVDSATQGPLRLTGGVVRIAGLSAENQSADISFAMAGGVADTLDLLSQPRLNLLSRHPINATAPAGQVAAKLHIILPLRETVAIEDIGISGQATLADVHLGRIAAGRDLDHGQLSLNVTSKAMHISGTGALAQVPSTLAMDMDFRPGPADQLVEHDTAAGLATPAALQAAGLPSGLLTAGTAALAVDYGLRRDGLGTVALHANLDQAAITTPFGWRKSAGAKASAEARLVLRDGQLVGFDRIAAHGPNLAIVSHAEMQGGLPRVLRLDQIHIDRTAATGAVTLATPNKPMLVSLHGNVLDLSGYFAQRDHPDPAAQPEDDDAAGPPWQADLQFGQVILARDEVLAPATVSAASDGRRLTRLAVSAGAKGEVKVSITPAGTGRQLSIDSADAGAVLLAAGVANNIRGGTLQVDGTYADTLPHAPLSGTARMADFRVVDAPGLARLLQAMTLYGTLDLLRGPGLGFRQAVLPFRWQPRILHLDNARAFSASLGLTAQGDIDLRHQRLALTGTIVPAYFFNQLLGNIPVLGQIFSPETGGGVFAARYGVHGALAAPNVTVNPLSALTPGILRNIFNIF